MTKTENKRPTSYLPEAKNCTFCVAMHVSVQTRFGLLMLLFMLYFRGVVVKVTMLVFGFLNIIFAARTINTEKVTYLRMGLVKFTKELAKK